MREDDLSTDVDRGMWIAVNNLWIKGFGRISVDKQQEKAIVIHRLSTYSARYKGVWRELCRKSLTDYPHIHRAYYLI